MAHPKKTLYEILGVPRDAAAADIGLAYERRKAQLERVPSPDPNEAILLREAHDVLRDPKRRAAYDATLLATEERTAAAAQASPDLVIGPERTAPARRPPWLAIGLAAAVVLVALIVAMRGNKPVAPDKTAAPGSTAPVKDAPPAPAPTRSGLEIIADASTSGGQVLSISMSGQAIPIGLALSTEEGTMVTTCHGIPAGAKLVVRVQGQSYPADLIITDEQLDLCKLQIATFRTPPVKVSGEMPRAGDRIFAVGASKAGELAATEGTIVRILATSEGQMLELSMPVGEFSSGGGVFDPQGRLVGIATFQHRSGVPTAYPATWIAQMRSRQGSR